MEFNYMIHEALMKSEVAKRYYKEKTGENLEREPARKRFDVTKYKDIDILKKVLKDIYNEQLNMLKKY